jgi:hypothetical protein
MSGCGGEPVAPASHTVLFTRLSMSGKSSPAHSKGVTVMRKLGSVLGLSVLLAGCAGSGDGALAEDERAALADSVRQFANEMVETIDRHDVDGFIAYHLRSPDFAWASRGAITPLDAHDVSMNEYFPGVGKNVHFKLGDSRVHVLSRDSAVATSIIHSTDIGEDGEATSGHEVWSIVVQCIDDEWKVVQAHESYPPRPPP